MKTTTDKLDHAIKAVELSMEVCASSKKRTEILSALSASADSITGLIAHLKEHEKRKFIPARKAFMAVSNVITGMRDGILDDAVSLSDVRASNRLLRNKFFPAIAQGLAAEVESQEAAEDDKPLREITTSKAVIQQISITLSKTPDMKQAVKVVSESSPTVGLDVAGDDQESQIEALGRAARNSLPVRLDGAFKIVRVPIAPLFPHMELMKAETLKRLGFKFVMIEGIVILLDQILLNVSKKRALNAEYAAPTPKGKKQKGPVQGTPLALAHSILAVLNERGETKYELVSDTPQANPRNTDLMMFWIVPRQRMAALMKIMGASRQAAIVKWGLPLPSDRADADFRRIDARRQADREQEEKDQETLDRLAEERTRRDEERKAAKEKRIADQKQAAADKKVRVKLGAPPPDNATQRRKKGAPPPRAKPSSKPSGRPSGQSPSKEKLEALVRKHNRRK